MRSSDALREPVRFGLVGSGWVSDKHARAIAAVPGAEVIACADYPRDRGGRAGRGEALAGTLGIRRYFADYRKMLAEPDIEAVVIGLPNCLHAEVAEAALDAGKHAVVEKPLCTRLEDADRIVALAARKRLVLGYAEELCFCPKFVRAKELVDSGAIGRVFWIKQTEIHEGPYSDWFFDPELAGGGALMDMGCHSIEYARWMFGKAKVKRVTAHLNTYRHRARSGVDDHAIVHLELEDGRSALIESGWTLLGGMNSVAHLQGDEGVLDVDLLKDNGIRMFSTRGEPAAQLLPGWSTPDYEWLWQNGYPQEMSEFARAIREGRSAAESGEDGRAVLEIRLGRLCLGARGAHHRAALRAARRGLGAGGVVDGSAMSELFLGVDGGGTKTVAMIADGGGHVIAAGRAGGSNYQSIGRTAAAAELRAAVEVALRRAGADLRDITAAAFGIAGADRTPEMTIVQSMVAQAVPVERRFVENDALLVLRAVTKDAVGVGLIAGTGTNCVGRDRYGRRHQVGGMGAISGDVGYAEDLAMRAIGGAWMASDGRTGPSALADSVPRAIGVETAEEIPRHLVRGVIPEPVIRRVVQCLFEQAREGDGLALRIIEDTGARLGAAAAAVMRTLVLRGSNAIVVLGGAMFQTVGHDLLVEAVERRIPQHRQRGPRHPAPPRAGDRSDPLRPGPLEPGAAGLRRAAARRERAHRRAVRTSGPERRLSSRLTRARRRRDPRG